MTKLYVPFLIITLCVTVGGNLTAQSITDLINDAAFVTGQIIAK